ncbi:MAG: hypothetical protein ABSH38_13210 [Verrucomicrobiota bacterium]|jgi:hypothetical protein
MAYEELVIDLLKAEREEDVTAALTVYGLEKFTDSNWIPYGGTLFENNYGLIGTQQADSLGALVEKVVNSIDAVLMRECLARNLDPRSNLVPRTMNEAAEQFLNIPEGNLAKLSPTQRTELAEKNISIIVTGQKPDEGNPCIIVADTGEGQRPEDFKDTLVSLLRSNKCSVPFVQGKFNMGSTGSLVFCSPNKNYQLIISRRNAAIPTARNSKWGFTLIRKRPPMKNEKNERYEYLAPKGKICELDLDEIPIFPDAENVPYKRPIKCGTIVKLYEYDLPRSIKTMATADFYRALSTKLWTVVVPMRIYEARGYKGHTLESTFSGMNIRLEDDKGDVLEEGFPCNFTLNIPKVGMVDGRICLFKKDAEISRWVSSREAIIYTINGQSHGALPNDFFRRQSVNLPWIQKQLLINIDCSRLDQQLINRMFMTSRDRQRDVQEKDFLESALAEFVRKHPGLREWNERRHRETVEEQFVEESETIELFEKLVAQNPALAEILGVGLKIKVPKPGEQPTSKFEGQRFPTFLKLEDAHNNDDFVKKCPQNSYCRVTLLTDAENDYLVRAIEPGKLIIRPEALVKSTSLYNGRLELQLAPEKMYDVGHRIEVKVMLTSPNSTEGYFSVRFWLEIDSPVQPKKSPPSPPKPPKVTTVALPEIKEIKKDQWAEAIEITSDDDVVKIMKDNQGTTSLVNMDNRHYRRYVYANPKREQEIRNLYKISSTIMGLWLLEQVDKGGLQEENRRSVSNSLGRLLLPLVDSLGSKLAELEQG